LLRRWQLISQSQGTGNPKGDFFGRRGGRNGRGGRGGGVEKRRRRRRRRGMRMNR